jgi:SAM-dependent methyltransferase
LRVYRKEENPVSMRIKPLLARATWPARYAVDRRRHASFVSRALADTELCRRAAAGEPLPAGHGVGLSERVVEYPWLLGSGLGGRVLDAGSVLNHTHVLDRVLPLVERLDIVTLAPERRSWPERGVSYLYADLRELPLRDGFYDQVVSLSTLEHVGMDVALYGGNVGGAPDPQLEARRAMKALRRVLKPGGTLYLSVPYGVRQRLGWLRQLDRGELEDLMAAFGEAAERSVTVFAYGAGGWQVSSLEETAKARYRDPRSGGSVAPDRARAARAVACVRLVAG